MADWFIATEGVKVVKDSDSLCSLVITAVSSAGTAFGGVWYGQWRITQREKEAAAAQLASEHLFIATDLVLILELLPKVAQELLLMTELGMNRVSGGQPRPARR